MKGKLFILVFFCIYVLKIILNVYIVIWFFLKLLNEMIVKSIEIRVIIFGFCDLKVISAFWVFVVDVLLIMYLII